MGWSQVVIWVVDRKDYMSAKFELKINNTRSTSFVTGTMWLKVFVLGSG